MFGCRCIGEHARAAVRADPLAHVHVRSGPAREFADAEVVYALGTTYVIRKCGPVYVSTTRVNDRINTNMVCPVGIPMFISSYTMNVVIAHEPAVCIEPDRVMLMQVSPASVARWMTKHSDVIAPACAKYVLERTGAWMSRVNSPKSEFFALRGIMPPIRRECGNARRRMTSRSSVVYVSRERNQRRNTYVHAIKWYIHERVVRRLRIRRGFTVDNVGYIIVDDVALLAYPFI